MFRRRPLLRAAAVGGGAYMAGKHVANRQAEQAAYEADQDQRISDLEQQQAYQQPPPDQGYQQQPYQQQPYQQQPYQQPPPQQAYQQPPPAPAASSAMIDQLNQLSELHQRGVLTDEEFAAAKAKLFGS